MTSVLFILMFYVSFMGSMYRSHRNRASSGRSRVGGSFSSSSSTYEDGLMLTFFSIGMICVCAYFLIAGTAILPLAILGIVIFGYLTLVGIAKMTVGSKNVVRSRSLSQQKGSVGSGVSAIQKRKIVEKVNTIFTKLERVNEIEDKMDEAMDVSMQEKFQLWMRENSLMPGLSRDQKPMTADQRKQACRALFGIEVERWPQIKRSRDRIRVNEIGEFRQYKFSEQVKRKAYEARLERGITLILTQENLALREANSLEAIFKRNEAKLKPAVEVFQKKGATQAEKDKAKAMVQEVVKEEREVKTDSSQTEAYAQALRDEFTETGIMPNEQETLLFQAYSRALSAFLLKLEKIWLTKVMNENPLKEDQKQEIVEGIKKIDESLVNLLTGKDLRRNLI